jgi:hypothetical protein
MRLGEAYVNVRADLKPYARDLRAGLKATTDAFEKELNKGLGQRFGRKISDGAREELVEGAKKTATEVENILGRSGGQQERRTRESTRRGARRGLEQGLWDGLRTGQNIATLIASSLASALDDGISALPVEVKAAIVAGLIAATPIIVAQLSGVIASATALGFAGLGIGLASQLKPVQDAFAQTMSEVRNTLVEAAGPLIEPIENALDMLRTVVQGSIGPMLQDLFETIAPGLEDLLNGITVGVNNFLGAFQGSGPELNALLSDLGALASELLGVIGEVFATFVDGGLETRIALRDLVNLIELTVMGVAGLARLLTEIYGKARLIVALIQGDLPAAANAILEGQMAERDSVFLLGNAYGGLARETDAETKALKEQEKALKDVEKAMDDLIKQADDLISKKIDSKESWADLTEAIKDNGATLNLNEEEGRDNARRVQDYLNDVRDELQGLVDTGQITADEAEVQFARQAAAAEKLFGKTKEGKKNFQELFGQFIMLAQFRFDPSPWIVAFNKIGSAIKGAIDRIKELQAAAAKTGISSGNQKVSGGTQIFDSGGRVTEPTSAILAKNYLPEVVLPETKPNRAAQILANSPLAGMLGAGNTTVYAYFDGEPFQARMVRTARGVAKSNARTTAQVPRSI